MCEDRWERAVRARAARREIAALARMVEARRLQVECLVNNHVAPDPVDPARLRDLALRAQAALLGVPGPE